MPCFRSIESLSKWEDDKSNEMVDMYMLPRGEGETMASQAVTAVNKLVYKYWNDGDTYDNSNGLGWVNDLSSYANWLLAYIPEKTECLTWIFDADCYWEYEKILAELQRNILVDEEFLRGLSGKEKVGSIYECDGPFIFTEREE